VEKNTEGAGAIAAHNAVRSGKLPDVVVTRFFPVNASLDAVAFALDLRKGQIDLRSDSSNVKTTDV